MGYTLGYTTTRGIHVIRVGLDIVALESQLQQLQQQIDPKATEALAAVRELVKALSLLTAAA